VSFNYTLFFSMIKNQYKKEIFKPIIIYAWFKFK
jgi:hypothetical protein